MKKIVAALIAFAMLLTLCACGTGKADSGVTSGAQTFDDPEELVRAFLTRLTAADADGIVALCSVDETLDNFSWSDYVERTQSVAAEMLYINDTELSRSIARSELERRYLRQLSYLINSLLAGENEIAAALAGGYVVSRPDEETTAEYDELMRTLDLSTVTVLGIADDHGIMEDASWQKGIDGMKNSYGIDDMCEYAFALEFGGHYYAGGLTLYHYDSGWKIGSLCAPIAGISATGALISLEAYDGLSCEDAVEAMVRDYGSNGYACTILYK